MSAVDDVFGSKPRNAVKELANLTRRYFGSYDPNEVKFYI